MLLVAAVLCLARRLRWRGASALAWLLIGAGVLAWTLGEIYYTAVLWTRELAADPLARRRRLPALPAARAGRASSRCCAPAPARAARRSCVDGIDRRAGGRRAERRDRVPDRARPRRRRRRSPSPPTLAYPLTDLVLLGVVVGALAGTGWRAGPHLGAARVGVSTFWLADSLYLVRTAPGTYESGGWFDAGWWAGLLLIAVAAWQRAARRASAPRERQPAADRGAARRSARSALALLVYGCVGARQPARRRARRRRRWSP